MAEQEPQELQAAGDEEEEENDNLNYKAPAPKSLNEIINQDQEDESLRKYKEQLLPGAGDGETIIIDPDNALNVIVKKLSICVDGRDDIELDLTMPKDKIKDSKIVLKDGCKYKVKLIFNVQRDIVTGLRYEQKASRLLVKEKKKEMVGSYAPRKEAHEYVTQEEEAPSGMLARGDYKVDSKFTDDDGHIYLEWSWHLSIKKDFE